MVPLPQYELRDNSCPVMRNLSFEFQFYHLFTRQSQVLHLYFCEVEERLVFPQTLENYVRECYRKCLIQEASVIEINQESLSPIKKKLAWKFA